MLKADFTDSHRKFNEVIDVQIEDIISNETKLLENFLKKIFEGDLKSVSGKLKKYKKIYLKKDAQSLKRSYAEVLNTSRKFAQVKLKLLEIKDGKIKTD